MKYLTIETVLQSFEGCRNKTQNKFWGMVCIIKAIGERIVPANMYSFSVEKVQTYLEDLFRLEDVKKAYSTSNKWSVVFSTYWVDFVPEQMFSSKPNIYDVAAWFYRRTAFDDGITPEQIVGNFMDLLNLSTEDSKKWFSFQSTSYTFDTQLYSESNLMDSILKKLSLSNSSNKTLSFEGQSFIKSNPGSLGQAPFVQTLYANQGLQKCLILTQFDFHDFYPVTNNNIPLPTHSIITNLPLQQIFYGAPGTGKSHTIKCEVDDKGMPCERTTFHPDSDYSTFVGAYKPTTVDETVMTVIGTKAVPVENPDGQPRIESKIVYEFVPQAFLKAYTGAWKDQSKDFYLIIEEINRGNCAQIFGDLFQLLDRNDETGCSKYPISPDQDIKKFLLTDKKYGFASLTDEQKAAMPEEVLNGERLVLPQNLHIWATMNTSDQSLFPIDSAFKRCWDWQYIPISNANKGWKIMVNGNKYEWWGFLEKMNEQINTTTNSEDKKMGYFFCKAKDGIIDAKTFVGKVGFYVWNDVFKDFANEAGGLFKDADGTLLSFNKFYQVVNGKTEVLEDKVEQLMTNLGLEPMEEGVE